MTESDISALLDDSFLIHAVDKNLLKISEEKFIEDF